VVMLVENGVVGELLQCKSNWCKVEVGSIKGWIRSDFLWGVDVNEVVG
jgi:SH3-like domain-containing protein